MPFAQSAPHFFKRMIWIDYSILTVLAVFLLLGLLRGARKESLSLCKWLLAGAVGWFFADDFSRMLAASIAEAMPRLAAAFAGMILLSLTVGGLIVLLATYGRAKTPVSLFGYVAGMPVGLLRGALFITLIVMLAGLTPFPKQSWWQSSQLLPIFQTNIVWLKDHFPSGFSGHLHYR